MSKYKLLTNDGLICDAPAQINANTEALRSNFCSNTFPDNPVKGQRCFVLDRWYTHLNGKWTADEALHHHDNKYYTKTESYTKQEVDNAIKNHSPHFTRITGVPSVFKPAQHTHTAAEISGLPASFPANGGWADTARMADVLATGRLINGVYFNGSGNISLVTPENWRYLESQYRHMVYKIRDKAVTSRGEWTLTLPAGGVWAYVVSGRSAGVAPGGTLLYKTENWVDPYWDFGSTFVWRVG